MCERYSRNNMFSSQPVTNYPPNSEWIPAVIENVTNFFDFCKAFGYGAYGTRIFVELADKVELALLSLDLKQIEIERELRWLLCQLLEDLLKADSILPHAYVVEEKICLSPICTAFDKVVKLVVGVFVVIRHFCRTMQAIVVQPIGNTFCLEWVYTMYQIQLLTQLSDIIFLPFSARLPYTSCATVFDSGEKLTHSVFVFACRCETRSVWHRTGRALDRQRSCRFICLEQSSCFERSLPSSANRN